MAAEQEEESYFVSMTDLMVGILFIFIILLMWFALNFKLETSKLTDAKEVQRELLLNIKQALDQRGVTVTIDTENGVLRLPEDVVFDQGRAAIPPEKLSKIHHLRDTLEFILPCYARQRLPSSAVDEACAAQNISRRDARVEAVLIEGHTDHLAFNGISSEGITNNWQLSSQRALNVYNEIAGSESVLSNLINQRDESVFAISGYADTREINKQRTEEARAQNRLIDLRFIMSVPRIEEEAENTGRLISND